MITTDINYAVEEIRIVLRALPAEQRAELFKELGNCRCAGGAGPMTTGIAVPTLDELEALEKAAFCAPWTAETWTVECNHEDDCGYEHDVHTVLSPDEYPQEPPGQVVAQVDHEGIHTPGLEDFAKANGKLIAAMRNALPALLAVARAARAMVTVCQYPCGDPSKCGNCNALQVALEALDR